MRRGDIRDIPVDGTTLRAEYLGKGMFATAYRVEDRVYLFVREGSCYMKEALLPRWCDPMPHLPEVKKHEDACVRGQWFDVYSMPYYRTLTAKDGDAWRHFRELERANEQARQEILREVPSQRYAGRSFLCLHGHLVNWRTIELADVPASLKDALRELAQAVSLYGSGCTFEFSKVNMAVDTDGQLILRDVAFDAEKLDEVWNERARRRRAA